MHNYIRVPVISNVISDTHVKSFIKYEYDPKNVQSPLTVIVVFDLETYNEDRTVPYCSCMYKLSKISGKYNQNITRKEDQNCLTDSVVFKGSDCINEMLDHISQFKGKPKKSKIKLFNIIYI